MHAIGKRLAWLAAGIILVCGSLLLPNEASAQFNIEGIIRGAMSHGCCYGGGYRYRSSRHVRTHESSREASRSRHEHEQEGETSDKSKERDATQVETNAASATHQPQQQPSASAQAASRSVESDAPAKPAANKSYDDQPAFSPAR